MAGQIGQRHQHVQLGQHRRGGLQSRRAGGHSFAQFAEQGIFQVARFFVGREHVLFVLFQFRGDVAFGVFDRLFANVVGRNLRAVRMRNLQIVAKNLIESDLEVGNARSLALGGLIAGDPLLAAAGQLAQRVELGRKTVAHESAVTARQRTLVGQCLFQPAAQFATQIEPLFELGEQSALAGRDLGFDLRNAGQRAADETQIARARASRRDTGQQPLEIVNRAELLGQGQGQRRLGDQFGHGLQPALDAVDLGQRVGQPVGQHPRTHRGERAIHDAQQRALAAPLAQCVRDLEAAARGRVDFQGISGGIMRQPIDVPQRGFLCFDQIAQYGAGARTAGRSMSSKPNPSSVAVPK